MIQNVTVVATQLQKIIIYHSFYLHQDFDALDIKRRKTQLFPTEFNRKALYNLARDYEQHNHPSLIPICTVRFKE